MPAPNPRSRQWRPGEERAEWPNVGQMPWATSSTIMKGVRVAAPSLSAGNSWCVFPRAFANNADGALVG